jgi:hypothetical protein
MLCSLARRTSSGNKKQAAGTKPKCRGADEIKEGQFSRYFLSLVSILPGGFFLLS